MMVVLMMLIMIVIWLTLINYLRQVVILRLLLWLGWCGQTNQGLVCSGILSAWLDYHTTRTERGGH